MRIFSSYRRLLSDIVLMWIIYLSGSWLFQFATTRGASRWNANSSFAFNCQVGFNGNLFVRTL